ncbi:MAG: hypothetical protein ABEK42_03255, partial [Thiohalorhabdaceae bacterium]
MAGIRFSPKGRARNHGVAAGGLTDRGPTGQGLARLEGLATQQLARNPEYRRHAVLRQLGQNAARRRQIQVDRIPNLHHTGHGVEGLVHPGLEQDVPGAG